MRIVFSRDRAAQLDLLLRSIERNMLPEETTVIWTASSQRFLRGYEEIVSPNTRFVFQETDVEFDTALRESVGMSETVTFFVDDDIVFRPVPVLPSSLLTERVLCSRLNIGQGNQEMTLPDGFPIWEWGKLENHNFGFVGGVDGETYRSCEVLEMLGEETVLKWLGKETMGNPSWVETVLNYAFREKCDSLPFAVSFRHQCVVGNPVNRVSPSSGIGCGFVFPQPTADLNDRFLEGQTIDYDSLDFSGVRSCHHEILFQWKKR
jgi:hypothetical protein